MFDARSLMMMVSGWKGMVSPDGVTNCCNTPRSCSISTFLILNIRVTICSFIVYCSVGSKMV